MRRRLTLALLATLVGLFAVAEQALALGCPVPKPEEEEFKTAEAAIVIFQRGDDELRDGVDRRDGQAARRQEHGEAPPRVPMALRGIEALPAPDPGPAGPTKASGGSEQPPL